MNIRCFDLGGGGLKTCVYGNTGQDRQCLVNLGASRDEDIASWIRERLPTLDQEISEDFVFSFSLAGLDKLHESLQTQNHRNRQFISELFALPLARVHAVTDGDAHLLASRTYLGITEFPQINFSVGTGVGIGMYAESGQLVLEHELTNRLGKNVWDFVTDSSASKKIACSALADEGYKELEKQDSSPRSRFERRWLKFLEGKFFPALGQAPKTITFTGGVIDYCDLFIAPIALPNCQIRRGPKHAGLLGAKLYAEQVQ